MLSSDGLTNKNWCTYFWFVIILYEIITPGSYIGLRYPPESLEIFFAARVVSKDVATEHIEDMNGHRILPGERYVEYLEKDMENASEVKYKLVKGYSFIHLGEIFVTTLEISDKLVMKMTEYSSNLS